MTRFEALSTLICIPLLAVAGCERQPAAPPQGPVAAASQPSAAVLGAIVPIGADAGAIAKLEPGEVYQHDNGVRTILSNDGTYRVAYHCRRETTAKGDAEKPPVNEPFIVEVLVYGLNPREVLASAALNIDAAMPEHGHGMNVEPTVTVVDDGHFRVENMLFHMAGRWEIYFDITRDGITSRAQDECTLE